MNDILFIVRAETHLSKDGNIHSNLSIKKVSFIRQLPMITNFSPSSSYISGLSNNRLFNSLNISSNYAYFMLILQIRVRSATHLSWDGNIRSNLSIEKVPFIRQLPTIANLSPASSNISELSKDVLFDMVIVLIHAD